jgi:hypothetical protein
MSLRGCVVGAAVMFEIPLLIVPAMPVLTVGGGAFFAAVTDLAVVVDATLGTSDVELALASAWLLMAVEPVSAVEDVSATEEVVVAPVAAFLPELPPQAAPMSASDTVNPMRANGVFRRRARCTTCCTGFLLTLDPP